LDKKTEGIVKWFDTEKGYGFIVNPEGEDVFVHYRSIKAEGFRNLREGQPVSFLQVKGEKGWQAEEVQIQIENEDESDQTQPSNHMQEDSAEE